jgi:hypothetical protein
MEAVQTRVENPNPETIWAIMQETDRIVKENAQGMKELRESQKQAALRLEETERIMKESSQRLKEELNNRIGALTNLFGDVTEAMIAPKICEKFEEFGLVFPRANPNMRLNDRVNKISFDVDIMLENSDKAMLIEVETKVTTELIDYHLGRMEKMRKYARLHGHKRAFLGAVASIVVTDDVKEYALKQGFYFIEYAGDNFFITPPNGKPKEW